MMCFTRYMVNDDLWTAPASPFGRVTNTVARYTVRPMNALLPANRFGALSFRTALAASCWLVSGRNVLAHTVVNEAGPRGRVRGEWVGGRAEPGTPMLYYIHGSGYIGCSPRSHRGLVSELSRRLGFSAFSVAYRRAPEHRFPAAQDDILNGFLWLLEQGHSPGDIVIAGDSAGGHLALGLCGRLREMRIAQPRAVIGFSALVDPTWTTAIECERTVHDSLASARDARRLVGLYTAGADLADPRLDVISTVGPDLPPMLLQAGAREMLSADSEYYGRALNAAGGRCEVQIWPGMFHVFQIAYPYLPEARAALDSVQRFVASLDTATTPARVNETGSTAM